ncbi:hypothetical protein ACFV2Q_09880 [Streptomyces sp. NPDC059650]|uniref:hypothetical protein n=1 Tax=Streptomyces sp. NPDC059650 TaxID=3346896 RepID=UPI003687A2F0
MTSLIYKRVSTDQQSTARQDLVREEAGNEDPVVFEEYPGTSSRLHPLQRPKFRALLDYARPGTPCTSSRCSASYAATRRLPGRSGGPGTAQGPPRIRQLMLYQRWLTERLAVIEDPEHNRLLRHFAAWHQMRRLRAAAAKGPLDAPRPTRPSRRPPRPKPSLSGSPTEAAPSNTAGRPDLGGWHTEKPATRRPAQTFLRWCMKMGRMPRLAMLRRVLNDDSLPLRSRVVAALVLLYAQPVSRIVCLTIDDITDDGTVIAVRLGDPPSPLPEPVADLLRAYVRSHQRLPCASSRSARWFFPGCQPGQPVNPVSLQAQLREIGVPSQRPAGLRPRHREGA